MRILITGGSGFIGTNLVEYFSSSHEILNLDIESPRNEAHIGFWQNLDIRNEKALLSKIDEFQPEFVFHMAARTDLDGLTLMDYDANIGGVKNIISSVNAIESVKKIIFASSRLVCDIGYHPKDMDDYNASTVYGQSKVAGEKIVKESDIRPEWIIVRPTSIWGPWFGVPYRNFFDNVYRGTYMHPNGMKIYKSFGYVGNAVHILDKLMVSDKLNAKTVYLQDFIALEVKQWSNMIRRQFNKSDVVSVPLFLLKMVAWIGDTLGMVKIKFPLTSFRLSNLTTNMVYDCQEVSDLIGNLPYTLETGTNETVKWYKLNK